MAQAPAAFVAGVTLGPRELLFRPPVGLMGLEVDLLSGAPEEHLQPPQELLSCSLLEQSPSLPLKKTKNQLFKDGLLTHAMVKTCSRLKTQQGNVNVAAEKDEQIFRPRDQKPHWNICPIVSVFKLKFFKY